jgi:pimeloyl-ACP methyl ester carboxylesterase
MESDPAPGTSKGDRLDILATLVQAFEARLGHLSLLDDADAPAAQITAVGERPIAIAHSMGGLLAQMLAARGLARGAMLLAPAAPAGVCAIGPSVVRRFWNIPTTWAFWRKPVH